MIRIAHTGDFHIYDKHKYSIGGSRLRELEVNLLYIVDWCLENKVDVLVIAGDIFHNHNPSEKLMKIFSRVIMRAVNGNIKVRALVGNHDTNGKETSLDSINDYIQLAPKVESDFGQLGIFKQATYEVEIIDGIALYYVPWCSDIRKVVSSAKYNQLKDINFLFTHASVAGAFANTGIRMKGELAEKMELRPVDLIGWDYVGLADFHQPQQLGNESFKKNNNVYYCGSPIKFDWGEKDHNKGFNVISVEDDKLDIQFVPLTDINFTQMELEYDDLEDVFSWDLDVTNTYIKLIITTEVNTKDIMRKGYSIREHLINLGARDVYLAFKKNSVGEDGAVHNTEIELDFHTACESQLKSEGIKDKVYMDFIRQLEAEIL